MKVKKISGFTLIELMVTIVVLAILTAIAYPSYQEYARRTRLSQARSALLENSQVMERTYAQHSTFKGILKDPTKDMSTSNPPKELPKKETNHFNLKLISVGDETYTLQATPKDTADSNVLRVNQDVVVVFCEDASASNTCTVE
ncbi:type IV pilin protein [Stenoxybacter acetivorans]|uniref:type IV pilin protein n=1 Tax=Stenoxybacter acetivorans TaxID=422441 RepID=UPI00068C2DDC|nr:type IV pilin protein [Stenoxybacter acetivorans]